MTSRRTFPLIRVALTVIVAVLLTASLAGMDTAPSDITVNFGDPDVLAGAANHVLVPDDAAVRKGGTVTYVVNGAGHGIALYPVSANTTRDDIAAQLCPHDPVCSNPAFANASVTVRDGKGNVIITSGTNPPFARLDDPTARLFATSTQIDGVPGAFLTGTSPTTSGTQLQFRFPKAGRYLAVCMNRNHFLSDWEFGFISVE